MQSFLRLLVQGVIPEDVDAIALSDVEAGDTGDKGAEEKVKELDVVARTVGFAPGLDKVFLRGVGSPPRFKELKEKLEGMAWGEDEDGPESWEAALPPDLKRAGPEIYSSMKASGVRCVRDWVNSMFSVEQRQSAHYVDLFNLATLVDFKAREGGSSQSKVLSIIAQDDTCEVALRRLAAWIHERRTGDRDAAQSMLAIKPSSFSTDVAPSWLVTEAASYSQSEHKRRERARAQGSASHGSVGGSGGGKAGAKGGKGKGKEKKKGAGGKAATQG
ncbi:hypothetical protein AK812_SmicGene47209 [Symbiodinium microadriaticum]|uniref:Uncharacterized protein n=1 Tax=Symbiodinium microadriaticum TaxID=2951 RepID=A0A1Q9BS88_SYMMI|nr:hypothetical protein AK812_SmicGene47209 [Symbiodinium microadriaticum]